MKKLKVVRKRDRRPVVDACYVAEALLDRVVGLMWASELGKSEGLWIKPCNSIHTFFMKFDIDVVYLDLNGKIVRVQRSVKPWRIPMPVFKAHSVLEVSSGAAAELREGDELWLS